MSHLDLVRQRLNRDALDEAHARRSEVTRRQWAAGMRRKQEHRRHRLKMLHLAGGA